MCVKCEALDNLKELILSETAIFDTVEVLNHQATDLLGNLEDSSAPDWVKDNCNEIRHIIWASMQITNDILIKIRNKCESEG